MAKQVKMLSDFIEGVEMQDIYILESSVVRDENFYPPANLSDSAEYAYLNINNGFKVYLDHLIKTVEKNKKKPGLSIYVRYLAIYESKFEMTDDLFKKFSKTNLVLDTWPYLRQYIYDVSLNIGLPPFMLQMKVSYSPKRNNKSK